MGPPQESGVLYKQVVAKHNAVSHKPIHDRTTEWSLETGGISIEVDVRTGFTCIDSNLFTIYPMML